MELCTSARDLGRIIRSERKRQGHTQASLADYAGVGVTFISNLENGKGTSEFDKVLRVAQTLGIDIFAEARS